MITHLVIQKKIETSLVDRTGGYDYDNEKDKAQISNMCHSLTFEKRDTGLAQDFEQWNDDE